MKPYVCKKHGAVEPRVLVTNGKTFRSCRECQRLYGRGNADPTKTIECSECHIVKSGGAFRKGRRVCKACRYQRYKHLHLAAVKRYRQRHPEKGRELARRWRLNNPEKKRASWVRQNQKPETKRRRKNQYTLRYFGIPIDEYERIFAERLMSQGRRCAICPQLHQDDRPLQLDHDHVSGKIRALLCGSCNVVLGLLQDDPRRLDAMRSYLVLHGHEAAAEERA